VRPGTRLPQSTWKASAAPVAARLVMRRLSSPLPHCPASIMLGASPECHFSAHCSSTH
jgi:hypothetical protein